MTRAVVESLVESRRDFAGLDIFLVDDNSPDLTAEKISHEFPEVRVYQTSGEFYWNKSMIYAFSKSDPSYYTHYLMLNDDVEISHDAISNLLRFYSQEGKQDTILVGKTCDPLTHETTYGAVRKIKGIHPFKFAFVEGGDKIDTFNANFLVIPTRVINRIGFLDPIYTHSMGDFDLGFRASRKGIKIEVLSEAIGFCSRNSDSGTYKDTNLGLRRRFKLIMHPKGKPVVEHFVFCARHGGIFWPVFFLSPYVGLIASSLKARTRLMELSADTYKPKRIAFLSGALRVSSKPNAIMTGPRSHINGIISGFLSNDIRVRKFILGDIFDRYSCVESAEEPEFTASAVSDLAKAFIGLAFSVYIYAFIGKDIRIVYERLGAFQFLGVLQKFRGAMWVLESNAIISREGSKIRNTIRLKAFAEQIERFCYRKADLIIAVSFNLKSEIVKFARIDEGKVIVIRNAVDPSVFKPHARKLSTDNLIIGFVGHLYDWQNLGMLINAIYKVDKLKRIRLIIVGSGPLYGDLQRLVDQLSMNDQVDFRGRLSQEEVINSMTEMEVAYSAPMSMVSDDIYVSPLKLYEYAAMCLPIIAGRNSDSEKLIADNKGGWLFDSDSSDELESILDSLLATPKDTFIDKGKFLRNSIIKGHTWADRVSQILEEIYRRYNAQI